MITNTVILPRRNPLQSQVTYMQTAAMLANRLINHIVVKTYVERLGNLILVNMIPLYMRAAGTFGYR